MFSFSTMLAHYHGDTVRRIFLLCAGVLMLSLPFAPDVIPAHPLFHVVFILVIGIMAGLTNPRQYWVIRADTVLAAFGFILFEYVAITGFPETGIISLTFVVRQLLAIAFFFALYFSAKTWRAKFLEREG